MPDAIELATAYVNLVPSFSGAPAAIAKGIGAPLERTGTDAGRKAGKKFSGGLVSAAKSAAGPLAAVLAGVGIKNFLGDALGEARESQKVGAVTEQVIRATGGAAKITATEVGSLTTALSEKAGVDDEAIQKGANLLLTFKNVRNEAGQGSDVFNRATAAAVDLAATGFGSVEGGSKMLGKALNDPVKGISALSRAGVTFTAQQKEQIATLVESGDTLGAQKIILGEVEAQVGGVAAASATMGEKTQVAFDNMKESIGTELVPVWDGLLGLVLKHVIPTLGKIGPLIQEIAGGVRAFGASWRANDGDITSSGFPGFMERIGYLSRQVFDYLGTVDLRSMLSGLMPLSTAIQAMLPALAPLLPQLRELGSTLMGVLARVLPMVGQAAAQLGVTLGTALAAVLPPLITGIVRVATVLGGLLSFISGHRDVLMAFGAGVLAIAVAMRTWAVIQTVIRVATLAWAAAQTILNVVLSANPIGIIVLALVGLVAGLVYAWKNSETFRRVVTGVWSAVSGAVMGAATSIGKWIAGLVAWFVRAWQATVQLKDRAVAAFHLTNTLIVAKVLDLRDRVVGFFTGLRDTAVNRTKELRTQAVAKITGLRDDAVTLATSLRDKVLGYFAGLRDTANTRAGELRDKVVGKLADLITQAVTKATSLRDQVLGFFSGLRDSANTRAAELRDKVVGKLGELVTKAETKATDLKNKVLAPFRALRDDAKLIFEKFRDAGGEAFDQLRDKAKEPIRFVIETIINRGLIAAFNKLAGFVGLDGIGDVPLPPGFRRGGFTGWKPEDQVAGVVHGRETVINAPSTRRFEDKFPGYLKYINEHGDMPGYRAGGLVMDSDAGGGGTSRALTSYRGHRFTELFVSRLRAAERIAGVALQIAQGGFRPTTSYSGTSHAGDAIDHQVNAKLIAAMRSVGIADWDRTGKGNWAPHAHGVPTPGAGYAGGSAIWQGQDYLRGGDGLGGRDNGPRGASVSGAIAALLDPGKAIRDALGKLSQIGGSPFAKIAGAIPRMIADGMIDKIKDLAGFANGSISAPAGMAQVGERGAELVLGRQVKSMGGGEGILSAGATAGALGGQHLHVHGDIVGEDVEKKIFIEWGRQRRRARVRANILTEVGG